MSPAEGIAMKQYFEEIQLKNQTKIPSKHPFRFSLNRTTESNFSTTEYVSRDHRIMFSPWAEPDPFLFNLQTKFQAKAPQLIPKIKTAPVEECDFVQEEFDENSGLKFSDKQEVG